MLLVYSNVSILLLIGTICIHLGHEKEVKALESLSLKDGLVLLVSLDVSGVLKIWDVFKEECLMTNEDSTSCIVRSTTKFSTPLKTPFLIDM